METYVNISKAAKYLGVSQNTLRNWEQSGVLPSDKTSGNHRRYSLAALDNVYDKHTKTKKELKLVVGYCRVSSSYQKNDLDTQIRNVETFCISKGYEFLILSDIGSGLNYNKPNFLKLIDMIIENKISKIVINYKDRLIRFGYEIIEHLCIKNGIEIEIINHTENKTYEEELVEDVLSLITVFSSKLYGARSHKNSKIKIETKKLFKQD